MATLNQLQKILSRFREERDWKQFHNPKDSGISLVLEATEVLEHFQWKNTEEINQHLVNHKDAVGEELADVLYWVLLLSLDLKIDLESAFLEKMKKNAQKYPVEKARGNHKKYTEL